MPGVGPAAVERAHGVAVGACDENLRAFFEGKDVVVVFEEHHRFLGGFESGGAVSLGVEIGIILVAGVGLVEQAEAVFHAEHAGCCVVDAVHRHGAFVDEFFKGGAESGVVGIHRHVDAGVDSQGDGFFLVLGNFLAREKVVDVGPVGHDHAVPVEVFFEPFCEEFGIGMHGHAVDRCGVHHHGKCAGADGGEVGCEIFFTQVLGRDVGRSAVLAREGSGIAHVVLYASGNVVDADVVGVVALETFYLSHAHFSIYEGVFAKVFPLAGPTGVAAHVEGGRVGPGAVAGASLVGGDGRCLAGHVLVERSGHVYVLREEDASASVGGAVVLVEAVDCGDAHHLDGFVVESLDDSVPFFGGKCLAGSVEDGAHLKFGDDHVHSLWMHLEFAGGGVDTAKEVDGEFGHLADFLLGGHLGQLGLHLGFDFGVIRNCRRHGLRHCRSGYRTRENKIDYFFHW